MPEAHKTLRQIFHCLTIVLMTASSFGQSGTIDFEHYTIRNGLSSGYISSIFQDSRGFIWIGTSHGLNRFDGISFKSYYFDLKDSTSIPGSNATSMAEDSLGRIWIMTNQNFCYYDRKTDNFKQKHIKADGRRIDHLNGKSCLIDSKGFLWIGSSDGIYRIKIYDNPGITNSTIEAEKFILDEDDVVEVYKNLFTSFVEDENGKVWAASYSNKLFSFDEKQNKFISQPIDYPEAYKFSNKIKGFFKDHDGDFYLSIDRIGLLIWNREKNIFSLYEPNGLDTGPKGSILFALAEDNNGLIWIGDRYNEGISIFNKKTKKFIFCQAETMNPYSLNTDKINTIFKDKTGSMWVGTIMGVSKYTPGKLKFDRYFSYSDHPDKLSDNNILCFTEDKRGNIWIGTDGGGLNMLDRKSGIFTHYKHNPSNPDSPGSDAVISTCEDHEGTIWFGTFYGGLNCIRNSIFHTYLPQESNQYSISDRNIWYVLEDSKRNMWVATLSNGLDLLDRKTGRFYHFTHQDIDSSSICDNSLVSLYEDSKQRLFITSYNGVSVIDLNSYDFSKLPPKIRFRKIVHSNKRNSISSNAVFSVMEDKNGYIWFGTMASGLDKLNPNTGEFTNYTVKDGLPGNSVHSILVDDDNNLWLATDKGLAQFNPETKEINKFDTEDGLLNTSFKSWALKTRNGDMFFGGSEGFNSFNPRSISLIRNQNKPLVVITELKIFNNPVRINEKINDRTILTTNISETHSLILTYKENFFSFGFIALEFTSPAENNYAYMMEGFDKDWVKCGTKHEASYTNLDPGQYTFRVKASNNDGIWNGKDSSIRIVILPPWWKTLWFRLIAIILVCLFFSTIFIMRVRQLNNQKLLLEKTVELKTVELNELNTSKDKFFSIIAHDLKNPFNSIIGLSDMMKESVRLNDATTSYEYAAMINSSAVQTYRLLENLLEWASAQRGKLEFVPEPVNLYELIKDEFSIAGEMAKGKNIKLACLIDESLMVTADKNMLKTILRNLISNAIKFTHRNGKVEVDAKISHQNAEVSVSDNGIGMSSGTMSKLFKLDANLLTIGTDNEKGTGLGLFLCKEFVEKHGGRIWVESKEGEGSIFKFVLPQR